MKAKKKGVRTALSQYATRRQRAAPPTNATVALLMVKASPVSFTLALHGPLALVDAGHPPVYVLDA